MKKIKIENKINFTTSLDKNILKAIKIEAILKDIDVSELILDLFNIEPEPKIKKRSRYKPRYKSKTRTPFCSKYKKEHIEQIKKIALNKKTDVSKMIEELWKERIERNEFNSTINSIINSISSCQSPLEVQE